MSLHLTHGKGAYIFGCASTKVIAPVESFTVLRSSHEVEICATENTKKNIDFQKSGMPQCLKSSTSIGASGSVIKHFKNPDTGQTLENYMYEVLRGISIQAPDGKYYSLDERLKREITTDLYKQKSDPIDIDGNQSDTGEKARHLRSIVSDYHSEVMDIIKKEAGKFVSTKDDSQTFTLRNSINNLNNNKMKMEMGVNLKMSDYDTLYQWSK